MKMKAEKVLVGVIWFVIASFIRRDTVICSGPGEHQPVVDYRESFDKFAFPILIRPPPVFSTA